MRVLILQAIIASASLSLYGQSTSASTDVATVEDGMVTGVAGGETYLFGTTPDGDNTNSRLEADASAIEVAIVCAPTPGSDQDDMCIWLHPDDPGLSTIITSDKNNSIIYVYDLDGAELYSYPVEHKPGNIDIVYNFTLDGEPVDLVGFNARDPSPPQFVFFKVDPQTRELIPLGSALTTDPWSAELYGFCLYHSPNNQEYYAFGCDYKSRIQQYRLFDGGTGNIAMEHNRTWQNGSAVETEGMVADHETGLLYAGNEQQGIYVYHADEDMTTDPIRFLPVRTDTLAADVEGLAIYYAADGKGYLLASSQGQSYFSVFEREGDNAFVRKFTVDGVGDTDGIDVMSVSLNDTFPSGIFTCHNGDDSPISINLVKWEDISTNVAPDLLIDTEYWDPRAAMPFVVGLDPRVRGTGFLVYPNPAEAMINILYRVEGNYTVELTAANGQLLISRFAEGETCQFDLSSFRKGVYFMTLRSKEHVVTGRIVKL